MSMSTLKTSDCGNGTIKRAVVYCLIGMMISILASAVITLTGHSGNGQSVVNSYGNGVLLFIAAIIVSPALEELLFRRFLFGYLFRQRLHIRFWQAAGMTSCIFGVLHTPIPTMIVAMILSMFLCYAYEQEKRIIYSVMIHAGFNLPSFIFVAVAA